MISLMPKRCRKRSRSTYLGEVRSLTSLVLGNLVKGVLSALLALAVGLSFLGDVDHFDRLSGN